MDKKQIFEKRIVHAPTSPGCYIWKDANKKVLYVGKAVNLKSRLSSYINNYEKLDPKIRLMVDEVDNVDYYTVDSEVEALILETNLIKKYRPKYNKMMKDDKNYSWIKIDWKNNYPRIEIIHDSDISANDKKTSEFYGPYPQKFPAKKVLTRLRKIFPYCDHLPRGINQNKFDVKPCFDTHIGLCSGICAGNISKNKHRKNINGIRKFLKGNKGSILEEMVKEMNKYSVSLDYESAAVLRDRIKDVEYVTQRIKIERDMDEEKLMLQKENIRKRGLEELLTAIKYFEYFKIENNPLEKFKIECYDISNIQGTNAVGSMVVFVDGKPAKNLYRKFKIKTKSTPDDFWMMREVLTRRLNRLSNNEKMDESFNIQPNLMIIDGGKGQLSSAYKILTEKGYGNSIPVFGLAKREEEIFLIDNNSERSLTEDGNFKKVKLPRRSDALYLIQRIRDEAHRFAIGYHRLIRSKGQTRSELDDIPGIGAVMKKRLIESFGTIERIKKASISDLQTVIKNKRTVSALSKVLKLGV